MQVNVVKPNCETHHTADIVITINSEESIMIQLKGDGRKLSAILDDFEDATAIHTDEGRSWFGYGDAFVIYRIDADTVQVRIRRSVPAE